LGETPHKHAHLQDTKLLAETTLNLRLIKIWNSKSGFVPAYSQADTTNIHAPGGIRTHNLSRREAEDLRLRPRGHWDRHMYNILPLFH
jgi:hypothetical protein